MGAKRPPTAKQIALLCARICEKKKAEDTLIIDFNNMNFIADYFVISTIDNPRHAKAIADELDVTLKQKKISLVDSQGLPEGTWVIQNYGDVWVHLFDRQTREYYNIEGLWAEAPQVKWKKKRKRSARKK